MLIDDLAGTDVAVTGAASGIGKRTAQWLTCAGVRVVALDRNEPDFEVSRYVRVDLSDLDSVRESVALLKGVRLRGLCNAAGVPGTLPDPVVARVNYLGLRSLTAALLPQLTATGAIVNVASVAGSKWGERVQAHVELADIEDWSEAEDRAARLNESGIDAYRFYKEALIVWTRLQAGEWLQRHGVRMNCVSPGPIDTPILDDFRTSMGWKLVDETIAMTGRTGTPDDVAPVIAFLLSGASRWIAGMDVPVDGGLTARRFAGNRSRSAKPPLQGNSP